MKQASPAMVLWELVAKQSLPKPTFSSIQDFFHKLTGWMNSVIAVYSF